MLTAHLDRPCTGISSIPHLNAGEGCRMILATMPELPYVPSTPRVAYKQMSALRELAAFPGARFDDARQRCCVDSEAFARELEPYYERYLAGDLDCFASDREFNLGLCAMLEFLAQDLPVQAKALKGQVTGPITVGFRIVDDQGVPIFYRDEMRAALCAHLAWRLKWLEEQLKRVAPHLPALLMIDEPFLQMYGSSYIRLSQAEVREAFAACRQATGGYYGIHCCGNTDWPLILEAGFDVVSFDAYHYGDKLGLYPEALAGFVAGGGTLAFGLIPVEAGELARETADSLAARLDSLLAAYGAKGVDLGQVSQSLLITPSCGAGSMEPESAWRAHALCGEVAGLALRR